MPCTSSHSTLKLNSCHDPRGSLMLTTLLSYRSLRFATGAYRELLQALLKSCGVSSHRARVVVTWMLVLKNQVILNPFCFVVLQSVGFHYDKVSQTKQLTTTIYNRSHFDITLQYAIEPVRADRELVLEARRMV